MNMRLRLNVAMMCVFLAGVSVNADESSFPADFAATMQQALQEWNVPGAAVGIVHDDKVVLANGYGVCELGTSRPVDADTIFAIASCSKAFTTACLGILVDEGKLNWDDPVSTYLPDFLLPDPFVTRELTVRDLVSHRTGYERCDRLWYGSGYSREEILKRCRWLTPASSFRSRYGYQNIMYLAAGWIVERVSGETWDDFVRERLFKPLGMKRSSTSTTALEGLTNITEPHAMVNDTLQRIRWYNLDNVGPCGSINSTVNDMVQWVRLMLGKGAVDGQIILQEKTVAELMAPQSIVAGDRARDPLTYFVMYGLGWLLSDYRGEKLVEHTGQIDGMLAKVALIPDRHIGVVILLNTEDSQLHNALRNRILDAFLGVESFDWNGHFMKFFKEDRAKNKETETERTAQRKLDTRPALPLEAYTGVYESQLYGTVRIDLVDGGLRYSFSYGHWFSGKMEHWHYDTFRVVYDYAYLGDPLATFHINSQGKPETLEIENLASFKRVSEG